MMTSRKILWAITDPRGLTITLTEDVWQEILLKHPEAEFDITDLLSAVRNPDRIYFDRATSQQRKTGKMYRYYQVHLPASAPKQKFTVVVVKVVYEDESTMGYVQTAWKTHRIQPRLALEWKK